MSFLNNLPKLKESRRKAKRVGRGIGSTKGGHTATRGSKGQKGRSGGKVPIWFEGGQTGLLHGMPYKSGFINHGAKKVLGLNLSDIDELIKESTKVTPELLMEKKAINSKKFEIVKILGKGNISKKVDFEGFVYTKKALDKIKSAGGSAN